MINDAPAPYACGGELVATDVMLFKVTKPLAEKDTSQLPDTLAAWTPLDPSHAVRERVLALTETCGPLSPTVTPADRPARPKTLGRSPSPKTPKLAPWKSGRFSPMPPVMFT